MNEVEAVARAIAPSRWEVMDHYLAQTKRKYAGENVAYDPDNFKDRESMATAQAAIAALDAARGQAEPVACWQRRNLYPLWSDPIGKVYQWETCSATEATGHFDRQPGYEYRPLYAHPTRGDQVARVVEWLRKENGLCDCHARCETECGCGAWDDWKTKPLLQIADAIERGEPFRD